MNELQRLRERNEELEETIRQLKEEIGMVEKGARPHKLRKYRITPDAFTILCLLANGKVARKELIFRTIYESQNREEPTDTLATVRVQISKLKKAVQPLVITVENVWGVGYRLSDDSLERAAALIEEVTT